MSCCGQKRQQWQTSFVNREASKTITEPSVEQPVAIYYRGAGSFLVKGKATGNLYLFGEKEPRLLVDYRDATFLLEDSHKLSLR